MKSCKRFLSLLFVCVLSFALFSVVAGAEETSLNDMINNGDMYYRLYRFHSNSSGTNVLYTSTTWLTCTDSISFLKSFGEESYRMADGLKQYERFDFKRVDGGIMFKKDERISVTFNNVANYIYDNANSKRYSIDSSALDDIYGKYTFSDGTSEFVVADSFSTSDSTDGYSFNLDLPIAEKDVTELYIYVNYDDSAFSGFTYDDDFDMFFGFNNTKLSFTVEEKEVGLLRNIGSTLADLPGKIWGFIENGLKSLFVPDEDYMSGYSDKWDMLLSDRLGAVYQVVQIVYDSWNDITISDQTDTIDMPEVTIPLPEGNSFTFGGYSVVIVPDGFGFITDLLKAIIGILVTIMFINGLYHRYDEVMGVEQ